MAKSLRSKVKQRYKRAKRHYIDGTLHTERITSLNENVQKLQQGLAIGTPRPKNAFLYPDDHEAVFSQKQLPAPVDFRSAALPLSGYCVTGCRRNFTDEEKIELNLVVGCSDGVLPLTRRLEQQARLQRETDEMRMSDAEAAAAAGSNCDADNNSGITGNKAAEEEAALISGMKGISFISVNKKATTKKLLHNLKTHQDKVGGRSKKPIRVPEVQNKLKKAK